MFADASDSKEKPESLGCSPCKQVIRFRESAVGIKLSDPGFALDDDHDEDPMFVVGSPALNEMMDD